MQRALETLAALSTVHVLRSYMEAASVNMKAKRLEDAQDGKELKAYPVNINTSAKSYTAGVLSVIVPAFILYKVVQRFDFTQDFLLRYSLIAIVVAELITIVMLDRYHIRLEKLIKRSAKSTKKTVDK